MKLAIYLTIAATLLSSFSHAESDFFNPIRPLVSVTDASSHPRRGLDCLSWRLSGETNNLRGWAVPQSCVNYLGRYLLDGQYSRDCYFMAEAAIEYAKGLKLAGDGKDVFVFDVDETALSNLPYLSRPEIQFGASINETSFLEFLIQGKAPALPAILHLYKQLLPLGFKAVFLTGLRDTYIESRKANLKNAGYSTWEKLILRGDADLTSSQEEFKSKKRTELVNEGYRILLNVGDQWSDILGANAGNRTFKVPNPMYYAG